METASKDVLVHCVVPMDLSLSRSHMKQVVSRLSWYIPELEYVQQTMRFGQLIQDRKLPTRNDGTASTSRYPVGAMQYRSLRVEHSLVCDPATRHVVLHGLMIAKPKDKCTKKTLEPLRQSLLTEIDLLFDQMNSLAPTSYRISHCIKNGTRCMYLDTIEAQYRPHRLFIATNGATSPLASFRDQLIHIDVAFHLDLGTQTQSLVQGSYAFYYYGCDAVDDAGWGCAYRCLQTIVSWYILNGHVAPDTAIPSHTAIQTCISTLIDRSSSFVGSNSWIGAFEASLYLNAVGFQSRVLHFTTSNDILQHYSAIQLHMESNGAPLLLGSGTQAFCILGIASHASHIMLLLLDPHYTGPKTIRSMVRRQAVRWAVATQVIEPGSNLCLPQS